MHERSPPDSPASDAPKPGAGRLPDKEQALIESARRELAARSRSLQPGSAKGSAAVAPATEALNPSRLERARPKDTDTNSAPEAEGATQAARIAALMAAERAETERHRQQVRRWGIFLPVGILVLMVLWMLFAYLRRFGG